MLNFFALIAIVLSILSFFMPITIFDYSSVLENNGYEDPRAYIIEESSLFTLHYIKYDYRDVENPSINHSYYFHNYAGIALGESYYHVEKSGFISKATVTMVLFSFLIIFLSFFSFFCYGIIKKEEGEKTKCFFYLGALNLLMIIVFVTSKYLTWNHVDVNKIGLTDGLSFAFGFYLMVISISLLFAIYLIRTYSSKVIGMDGFNEKT